MAGPQYTSFVVAEVSPTAFDPDKVSADNTLTWSNGNRTVVSPRSGNHDQIMTVAPLSAAGKSYWEITINSQASPYYPYLGIGGWPLSPQDYVWWYGATGAVTRVENGISKTGASYSTFGVAGDVIGFAVDWSARTIWMRKNGVWQGGGDPVAGTGGISFTPTASAEWYAVIVVIDATLTINAGNAPFAHDVPSGFEAGLGLLT